MSDTISRQTATDALRKMQTYKMFSGDDMLLIDQAGTMTELMLLPPAEPKRGKWIRVGSGSLYDNYFADVRTMELTAKALMEVVEEWKGEK